MRPAHFVTGTLAIVLLLVYSATVHSASVSSIFGQDAELMKESQRRIERLVEALHTVQHPPKESCKSRRLLIMQILPSFEGLGCNLKFLTVALAEAAYSNRTVVWGLDLPLQFHNSRVIWQGRDIVPNTQSNARDWNGKASIGGIDIDCENGWHGQGGGAFSCFFQNFSSCSLEDVTMEELLELGKDGFNDESRLRLVEARRGGTASHHPPVDVEPFAAAFRRNGSSNEDQSTYSHEWAASLAAYVFRLKRPLAQVINRRRRATWPKEAGGRAECQCGGPRNFTVDKKSARVWGLHVRHGDSKAMPDIYGNRGWYPFGDYFRAARKRANELMSGTCSAMVGDGSSSCTVSNGGPPTAIFVASDGPDIYKEVKAACSPEELDKWPGGAEYAPCIFVGEPSERYRTEHGSHTAAADGGCWHTRCAIKPEWVMKYRTQHEQTIDSLAERIMRSLIEAVEDMHLLSRTDYVFGVGTSHFSLLGMLLSWARTGIPRGSDKYTMMDQDLIDSGVYSTGFLHGALNGSSVISPERGYMRWVMLTRRFIEGLFPETVRASYDAAPEELKYVMRFVDGVPMLPEEVFKAEAPRWLGTNTSYRVWPGECPIDPPPEVDLHNGKVNADSWKGYVAELINLGVEHRFLHPGQAMKCWKAAKDIIGAYVAADRDVQSAEQLMDVVNGNIEETRRAAMVPYSGGEEVIRNHLRLNVLGNDVDGF